MGTPSRSSICRICCTSASFITPGINSSTTVGAVCFNSSIEVLRGVAGEDFVGMAADGFGQVRGDHAARLDDRVAEHLGLVADAGFDPHGGRAEGRVLAWPCPAPCPSSPPNPSPGTCRDRPTPSATAMSAILMRYWFCSSRMLSRMRTLGRMMPMSAATFWRTRWIRSSRSPPRRGSARRISPTPISTSIGSTAR